MAIRRSALTLLAPLLLGCGSVAELLGVIGSDAGPTLTDASGADAGPVFEAGGDFNEATRESSVTDADSATVDADADAPQDAGILRTSFGPPSLVTAIADIDADNEDPSMTGDSLELYFLSTRSGTAHIWLSVRGSPDAGWGAPQPVDLNSDAGEGAPGVSLDGLTLWFSRSAQIWVSTRAARVQPWGAPAPVTELNTAGGNLDPAVDESSLLMFFASDRGDAGYDLYASSRADVASSWGPPAPIAGLNTSADDLDPFVASYGLQVWFASSRSGAGDLFWSYRASTSDPFALPVALDALNSTTKESDPTLSADLHYILFASNRLGLPQIFEAYR